MRLRHPLWLYAAFNALVFVAAALQPEATDWTFAALALAVPVVAVGLVMLAPLRTRPHAQVFLLAVLCELTIALMREAQGGSRSGYSALALLPVLWTGLTLPVQAVVALLGVETALFVVPLAAVGSPLYPSSGWRGAVLAVIVAAVVTTGAELVVAALRREVAASVDREQRLGHVVAMQKRIAASPHLDVAMQAVVDEARQVTHADAAVLEMVEGDDLVYRAVAGTAVSHRGVRIRRDGSLSGLALREGELLHSRDCENDERVDSAASERVGARSMIVVPVSHDGSALGVLKVYSATLDAFAHSDAQLVELLASSVGSALARAELLQRANEEAVTDSLTGALNRRGWFRRVEEALSRARRLGQPLTIVTLDVDGLKQVNDTHGHQAGDDLLREMTGAWQAVLRPTDILGRIGGDEFAILLEGAGPLDARHVLDRLDASVERTASAGCATWNGEEDAHALLSRADAEMYKRKQTRGARASAA